MLAERPTRRAARWVVPGPRRRRRGTCSLPAPGVRVRHGAILDVQVYEQRSGGMLHDLPRGLEVCRKRVGRCARPADRAEEAVLSTGHSTLSGLGVQGAFGVADMCDPSTARNRRRRPAPNGIRPAFATRCDTAADGSGRGPELPDHGRRAHASAETSRRGRISGHGRRGQPAGAKPSSSPGFSAADVVTMPATDDFTETYTPDPPVQGASRKTRAWSGRPPRHPAISSRSRDARERRAVRSTCRPYSSGFQAAASSTSDERARIEAKAPAARPLCVGQGGGGRQHQGSVPYTKHGFTRLGAAQPC